MAQDLDHLRQDHDQLAKDVHEFMILKAREDGELAGYVRNAAKDIKAIRVDSARSTEAFWGAIKELTTSLTDEVQARAVADKGHEGALNTMSVDLTGKIRTAGYAKIIAFIASAGLFVLGATRLLAG